MSGQPGEAAERLAGSDVQVVQYPGGGPAMKDVMGSHIEYSIGSMTQMLPQIRAGNIKPIAVTSSERSEAAPDVPTLQEAGLSDYEVRPWWGILAPAGAIYLTTDNTGEAVLEHEAVHKAQWKKYGLAFIALYIAAGSPALTNRFEVEAGLEKGGYVRPRKPRPGGFPGKQPGSG